ncbi:MAG: hypothetical protein ABIN67_02340 [Ferruginibacter sp.]
MRPQDIVVLSKIVVLNVETHQLIQLANSLCLSISEISESLNRSFLAGLIDYKKKKVNRQNLVEFLEHGIRYVFPQMPGAMVRGIPTAHSHPFMKIKFISEIDYVWPDNQGDVIGLLIEPLYAKQVEAVKSDPKLYELLALIDVIRVGKAREVKVAINQLKRLCS